MNGFDAVTNVPAAQPSDADELVAALGEKRLIQEVLSGYAATADAQSTEDCIVIDPDRLYGTPGAPLIVYSMDHSSLIDRPMPDGFGWRYHGRWLAACTCNDVLAMGAQPRGLAVDLAISPATPVAAVRDLYTGITDVLGRYGAQLEGGNTDINTNTETVAMCWGTVSRDGLIRRRGARPGDYVVVTTELGLGWASFLLRKLGSFGNLDPVSRCWLEQYNLMPLAPRSAIVEAAATLPEAITSGMDLSDGLAEFLYIIDGSGLGAVVDEGQLPASAVLRECAALLEVPPGMLAVEYGFDMPRAHGYTVAPQLWESLKAIFDRHDSPLFKVGEVESRRGVRWRTSAGDLRTLPAFWDDKCHRLGAIDRWFNLVRGNWNRADG